MLKVKQFINLLNPPMSGPISAREGFQYASIEGEIFKITAKCIVSSRRRISLRNVSRYAIFGFGHTPEEALAAWEGSNAANR